MNMRDYPALHLDTEYERLSSITTWTQNMKDYPALHLDTEYERLSSITLGHRI